MSVGKNIVTAVLVNGGDLRTILALKAEQEQDDCRTCLTDECECLELEGTTPQEKQPRHDWRDSTDDLDSLEHAELFGW